MDDVDSKCNLYLHRENAAWAPKKRPLPVLLVTGFLGSGKTTLLRHILSNRCNLRIAAAVNDLAEVNVDAALVASASQEGAVKATFRNTSGADGARVVELGNGCMCCAPAAGEQLGDAVAALLEAADRGSVQYLVIETSGATDPTEVVRSLDQRFGKFYRCRLDSVVCVVDADALRAQLALPSRGGGGGGGGDKRVGAVAMSQLRCADVVLLNKADLLGGEAQAAELEGWLGAQAGAGGAPPRIIRCVRCAVALDALLEVQLVDKTQTMQGVHSHESVDDAYTMLEAPQRSAARAAPASGDGAEAHAAPEQHDSFCFESDRPLALHALQNFLGPRFPAGILRMKGSVLVTGDAQSATLHMSGRRRYEWVAGEGMHQSTQLIVIGQGPGLRLAQGLLAQCVAAEAEAAEAESDGERVRDALALVAGDERFDAEARAGCLLFRLTASRTSGVSPRTLASRYRIDLNAVNEQLLCSVNCVPGDAFLTSSRDGETVWLRWDCRSEHLALAWSAVQAAADVAMAGAAFRSLVGDPHRKCADKAMQSM